MPDGDEELQGRALGSGQRLDKWLWFARVVKSRTLAASLVTSGKVRVNRQRIDKPAHALKPGDVVTVSVGRRVRVLKVVAPGLRRGPASEAHELFEELAPRYASPNPDPSHRNDVGRSVIDEPHSPAERGAGAGRPTKRDRRLIDHLRGRR
jgi:ribosome-associated heat shock protein Hsp15